MEPHVQALLDCGHLNPPSRVENGHACALSLMAVLLIDALANRAAYMIRELGPLAELARTPPINKPVRDNAGFILVLLDAYHPGQPTPEALIEAYVLRNVLAHNYLWLAEYGERDDPPTFEVLAATLVDGFGDKRFATAVDGRFSRTLRLNLLPTSVDRRDAGTVVGVSWQTVEFLSHVGGANISTAGLRISVRRRLMTLPEVAQALIEA